MIVVVGQPTFRASDDRLAVDGVPARIALAAASLGRSVQLVGKAGEDPEGDAVVMALARGGVGHVALLRDAGSATQRAAKPSGDDLDLLDPLVIEGIGPAEPEPVTEPVSERTALDKSDVDLALQYLTEFEVLVLAEPAAPDVVQVVADAAGWAGARLIVVVAPGQTIPETVPSDAIVFEAPDADPDGAFASVVGSFAAALDDGEDPGAAFRSSIEADGWAVSTGD